MTKHRLTFEDRKKIEKLFKRGYRPSDVANIVGVHRQTIYNELKRSETTSSTYSAQKAQNALR